MAKDFLNKNNVAYQEKDVAADEKTREEMVNKSGQLGVPVIEIGEKVLIGFDQATLADLLGIKE